MKYFAGYFAGYAAVILAFVTVTLGPIINHVVWCIQTANDTWQPIALLVAGVAFPPLGWVHGVSLMFGFTWI